MGEFDVNPKILRIQQTLLRSLMNWKWWINWKGWTNGLKRTRIYDQLLQIIQNVFKRYYPWLYLSVGYIQEFNLPLSFSLTQNLEQLFFRGILKHTWACLSKSSSLSFLFLFHLPTTNLKRFQSSFWRYRSSKNPGIRLAEIILTGKKMFQIDFKGLWQNFLLYNFQHN